MSRKWWILLSVLVVLVAIVFSIPFFINVNVYRAAIQSQLSKTLNRDVELNDLRFSILPVAIESKDVRIGDDPRFRPDAFIQVRSFRLLLSFWPLLHRQIQINSLELVDPNVWLVKNAQGVWNFSTLGNASSSQPLASSIATSAGSASGAALNSVDISSLSIKNGRVIISDQAHPKDSRSYDILDFSASDISGSKAFPFSLTASGTVQKEPVRVEGEAGPLDFSALYDSPAHGTIEAQKFHFGTTEMANLRGKFTVAKQTLKIDPMEFDLYSGHQKGSLAMDFGRARPTLDLVSQVSKVDTHQYLATSPATRDTLYGLLSGNLQLHDSGEKPSGSMAGLSGHTYLDLQKGKLARLSIGKEIVTVAKIVGVNFPEGATPINKLTGNFDIANNWANTNDLQIEVPDINLLCQGGFNFDNEMKLNILATFSEEVSQKIRSKNALGGLLSAILSNPSQQISLPLQVTGTFQNPHFRLDSQRLFSTQTQEKLNPSNIQQTIQSLQDLFKKKK